MALQRSESPTKLRRAIGFPSMGNNPVVSEQRLNQVLSDENRPPEQRLSPLKQVRPLETRGMDNYNVRKELEKFET
jgi:hypothetical protein